MPHVVFVLPASHHFIAFQNGGTTYYNNRQSSYSTPDSYTPITNGETPQGPEPPAQAPAYYLFTLYASRATI